MSSISGDGLHLTRLFEITRVILLRFSSVQRQSTHNKPENNTKITTKISKQIPKITWTLYLEPEFPGNRSKQPQRGVRTESHQSAWISNTIENPLRYKLTSLSLRLTQGPERATNQWLLCPALVPRSVVPCPG